MNVSEQHQHDDDRENRSQPSAGVVTPSSAVRPRGQREYQQYDQQGCQQAHGAPPPKKRPAETLASRDDDQDKPPVLRRPGSGTGSEPPKPAAPVPPPADTTEEEAVPLSTASQEMRSYLSQSVNTRKPVGYNREFLDSYRPNETFYLSQEQRAHLARRYPAYARNTL